MIDKTIAAIATAPGKGGIAVIRISGPHAWYILNRLLIRATPTSPIVPWKTTRGKIIDPLSDEILDDVLATYFQKPLSYTGEDMAEISCHGSPAVQKTILDAVFRSGAEPAGPGEFTRRAFSNGRIDLSQAEAVALLTAAESDAERRIALTMLSGGLAQPIRTIRERLLACMAHMELDLDFPEEEPSIPLDQTIGLMESILTELKSIQDAGFRGESAQRGLRLVLAGNVNVGKSRLFNRLIGRDKAIVADEPGTTRDALESVWEHSGITMMLIDTAGIRETASISETEAIRRSKEMLQTADIVVYLIDIMNPDPSMIPIIHQLNPDCHLIVAFNKIDLLTELDDSLRNHILASLPDGILPQHIFFISAKIGTGLEDLRKMIISIASLHQPSPEQSMYLLSIRQQHALRASEDHVRQALQIIVRGEPIECSVPELRAAWHRLGDILGDHITPDVLDVIFSRFCIGK